MEKNLESELHKLKHFSDIARFKSRDGGRVYVSWKFRSIIEKNTAIFKHGPHSWTIAEMLDYTHLGIPSASKDAFIDAVKRMEDPEINSYIDEITSSSRLKIYTQNYTIKDPYSNSELYRLRRYTDIANFRTPEGKAGYPNCRNFYTLTNHRRDIFSDWPDWRLSQMIEYALSQRPTTKKSMFICSVYGLQDPEVEKYILELTAGAGGAERESRTSPNNPTNKSQYNKDFLKRPIKENKIPEKPKSDSRRATCYLDFGVIRNITGFDENSLNEFINQEEVLKIIRMPKTVYSSRIVMVDIGSLALHLFRIGYETEAKKLDSEYSRRVDRSLREDLA